MHPSVHPVLRPALWTAGALLSALPTAAAARLADGAPGWQGIKALGRAGFEETARRLLLHRLATPPTGAEFDGIVLIAGSPRIGKSTVAEAVARALRMRVLSTDDLEPLCGSGPQDTIRMARRRLLDQICRQARGVVLEGKALVRVPRTEGSAPSARFGVDPGLRPDGKAHLFAVGCCDSSPEVWETVLRRYGGWVADRGEDYLRQFAGTRGKASRRLRDLAGAEGVDYFDIPREDFAPAVERTVAAIVDRVRTGARG